MNTHRMKAKIALRAWIRLHRWLGWPIERKDCFALYMSYFPKYEGA